LSGVYFLGFGVHANGTVYLTSSLPRDVTTHVIDVLVRDTNKPDFETNVVITLNVNSEMPFLYFWLYFVLDEYHSFLVSLYIVILLSISVFFLQNKIMLL